MLVTVTEFKKNIAKLSKLQPSDKVALLDELVGIASKLSATEERLTRQCLSF